MLAFPQFVRKLDDLLSVVRVHAPARGKVAVVTGAWSRHEPLFAGYVGPGMAAANVTGSIFTSPPPGPIFETAKAVNGDAGVLFIYGNSAGDLLNFNLASEMLSEIQIENASIQVTDHVSSAPPNEMMERSGIAGGFFVIRIAGAAAEEGCSLAEVAELAARANAMTRSIGVALISCAIPSLGQPIFQLNSSEIAIGMGIHGEPGEGRSIVMPADQLAAILLERLLLELNIHSGDELGVLVNGQCGLPLCGLLIVSGAVSKMLSHAGIRVVRTYVGNFATSHDTSGCSLSLLKLDSDLKRLVLAPAESPAFVQV